MIEASGLRKDYGEVRALDGIGFEVASGTVFGLLGPNGGFHKYSLLPAPRR